MIYSSYTIHRVLVDFHNRCHIIAISIQVFVVSSMSQLQEVNEFSTASFMASVSDLETTFNGQFEALHEGSDLQPPKYIPGTVRINRFGVYKRRDRLGTHELTMPGHSMQSGSDIHTEQNMNDESGYMGDGIDRSPMAAPTDEGNEPYAFVLDISKQISDVSQPIRHGRVVKAFAPGNLEDKFEEMIDGLRRKGTALLAARELAPRTASAFESKANADRDESLTYFRERKDSLFMANSVQPSRKTLDTLSMLEDARVLERLSLLLGSRSEEETRLSALEISSNVIPDMTAPVNSVETLIQVPTAGDREEQRVEEGRVARAEEEPPEEREKDIASTPAEPTEELVSPSSPGRAITDTPIAFKSGHIPGAFPDASE